MQIELIKTDNGKTTGYKLIPENTDEKYVLNELRNNYFFGEVNYDGRENGCSKFAGNLIFKFANVMST